MAFIRIGFQGFHIILCFHYGDSNTILKHYWYPLKFSNTLFTFCQCLNETQRTTCLDKHGYVSQK